MTWINRLQKKGQMGQAAGYAVHFKTTMFWKSPLRFISGRHHQLRR